MRLPRRDPLNYVSSFVATLACIWVLQVQIGKPKVVMPQKTDRGAEYIDFVHPMPQSDSEWWDFQVDQGCSNIVFPSVAAKDPHDAHETAYIDFDKAVDCAIRNKYNASQSWMLLMNDESTILSETMQKIWNAMELGGPRMWKVLSQIFVSLKRSHNYKAISGHLYDFSSLSEIDRQNLPGPLVLSNRFWSDATRKYYDGDDTRILKKLIIFKEHLMQHGMPGDTLLHVGHYTNVSHIFSHFFEQLGFITTSVNHGGQLTEDENLRTKATHTTEKISEIYGSSPNFVHTNFSEYLQHEDRMFDHISYVLYPNALSKLDPLEPVKVLQSLLNITKKSLWFEYGQTERHVSLETVMQTVIRRKDVDYVTLYRREDEENHDYLVVVKTKPLNNEVRIGNHTVGNIDSGENTNGEFKSPACPPFCSDTLTNSKDVDRIKAKLAFVLICSSVGCGPKGDDIGGTLLRHGFQQGNLSKFDLMIDLAPERLPMWNHSEELFSTLPALSTVTRIPGMTYRHSRKHNLCIISERCFKLTGVRIVPPCVPTPVRNAPLAIQNLNVSASRWIYKNEGNGGFGQKVFEEHSNMADEILGSGVLQVLVHPTLYGERKIDFRLHGVITSLNPLRLYISSYGWTRLGYSDVTKPTNMNSRRFYRTQTVAAEGPEADAGSLSHYWTVLRQQGFNPSAIWSQIGRKLSLEFVLEGTNHYGCTTNDVPYTCGSVGTYFTADVIVDHLGEPYIMESQLQSGSWKNSGGSPILISKQSKSKPFVSDPVVSMQARMAQYGGIMLLMAPRTELQFRKQFLSWIEEKPYLLAKLKLVNKYEYSMSMKLLTDMTVERMYACHVAYESLFPAFWKSYSSLGYFDEDDETIYSIHDLFMKDYEQFPRICEVYKF